jgi:hypothetical protein
MSKDRHKAAALMAASLRVHGGGGDNSLGVVSAGGGGGGGGYAMVMQSAHAEQTAQGKRYPPHMHEKMVDELE